MGTLSPKLSQSLDARWRRGLAVLLWSAALLLEAGWGIAILQGMDVVAIRWLTWGFGLFLASGAIWVAILIPIQIKQAGMTRRFANGGVISDDYWRLTRLWNGIGTLATILPLINIYWMVCKPS